MRIVTIYFLLLFSSLYGQNIPDYYATTNISYSNPDLENNLSELIHSTHNLLDYTDMWEYLVQTDQLSNSPNKVILLYGYNDQDSESFNDRTRSKYLQGTGQGRWNREHVYPRSLGTPNLGFENAGADLHSIRSTDAAMNSTRSNRVFGKGNGDTYINPEGEFYPGDEWIGDVARMIFYMHLRYPNQCKIENVGDLQTFLEWNRKDPVSEFEKQKNERAFDFQHNRNPFIDNPVFASILYGGNPAQDFFSKIPAPRGIEIYKNYQNDLEIHLKNNRLNDSILLTLSTNPIEPQPKGELQVGDQVQQGRVLYKGKKSPIHLSDLEEGRWYYFFSYSLRNNQYSALSWKDSIYIPALPLENPKNVSLTSLGENQLEFFLETNTNQDSVLFALHTQPTIDTPASPYNSASSIQNGILLGSLAQGNHQLNNLKSGTTYYLKFWSYNSEKISSGVLLQVKTKTDFAGLELPPPAQVQLREIDHKSVQIKISPFRDLDTVLTLFSEQPKITLPAGIQWKSNTQSSVGKVISFSNHYQFFENNLTPNRRYYAHSFTFRNNQFSRPTTTSILLSATFSAHKTIFPNPSNGSLNLSNLYSGKKEIWVFNSQYQLVHQVVTDQEVLDFSFLQKGIYLLQIQEIENRDHTLWFKWIIE